MAFLRSHLILFGGTIILTAVLFFATMFNLGSYLPRPSIENFQSYADARPPNPLVEESSSHVGSSITPSADNPKPLTFYEIAKKHGTDKVTDHSYQNIYEKYLEPIRDQPLKFLEIGLGCNMYYGPGASYYTWLEYLPNVDLYFIEYDATCASKLKEKLTGATIISGDQGDQAFLERFIRETGGQFDVIVDDGGHTMSQQKTSLDTLWKAVKPGGYYFIEDLHTSFIESYGGGGPDSTVQRLMDNIAEIMTRKYKFPYTSEVFRIDCMREVCGLSKKLPDGLY